MGELVGGVFFLFIAAVVISAVIFGLQQSRAAQEAIRNEWSRFAEERGFSFYPGTRMSGPATTGEIRGFSLTIDQQQDQADSQVLTRYTVRYPTIGAPRFELTKQSTLQIDAVKSLFGINDVEIDDPAFDKSILIDTQNREAFVQYMSPARRQAVLHLFDRTHFRRVRVTDSEVAVMTLGLEKSATQLAAVSDGLLWFAEVMSSPTDVDLALEEQHRGPKDATPPPPAPSPPHTPPPQTPPLSVGFHDAIADEVHAEPVEMETAEAPAEAPAVSLDQLAVAADLFDSTRMGFATDDHFAAIYAGESVTWNGTVDMVREIRSDSDFAGGGQKVVVLLGILGDERMRSSRVHAAVQLKAEVEVARGDEITFCGTLVRADRFTRQLYVADAAIVGG